MVKIRDCEVSMGDFVSDHDGKISAK